VGGDAGAACRVEGVLCQSLAGEGTAQPLHEEGSPLQLQWESPGVGSTFTRGAVVKAEVTVTADVQGAAVAVEKCAVRGRLGTQCCVAAVEVLPRLLDVCVCGVACRVRHLFVALLL
jgi:hypothetical protein